ncbi:hypothetical protein AAG589_00460 [Isoptericola sp. F-RaC21]|uniref:hypothetical protein n=1 Tax=Isoptericola sp. F-RaC21 TaxID=3141452 RepID=UPI00315B5487
MYGRHPPQVTTLGAAARSGRRSRKTRHGVRGALVGLLAAACGTSVALAGPAGARPFDDEERDGPRSVLDGRASLSRAELGDGGWSIVTDMTDRLVLVAGPARVRVVVDAALGANAGDPRRAVLVAALADTPGTAAARYVTRPAGVFVVFDADPSSTFTLGQKETWPGSTASGCTALPWPGAKTNGATLTGEGDAKVVLGTPCTVERVYVVARGRGNFLIEAQAPRGTDDGRESLATMDDLVMSLVPAGARIDDNLSPLEYANR